MKGSSGAKNFIHSISNARLSHSLPASRFTVRLGEHDYLATDDGANPVDVDVSRVFSHPNFNNRTYFNDIAIMRYVQSERRRS